MQYHHFTIQEREQIQDLLRQRRSIRSIATTLQRSPSSISREIQRNNPPQRQLYTPRLAHERAVKKRRCRGRVDRLKNAVVRSYTTEHLKLGWSPEQITGTIHAAIGETISHEAIYQYIYAQIHRNGHGEVKAGCEDLRPYLARARKRRMRKEGRKVQRMAHLSSLPSITHRPAEVEKRQQVGHWEDDLVISRASTEHLKTINERVSGLVLVGRVRDGSMAETNRVVIERLSSIPASYRRSLTRDRGSENMGYKELEETLHLNCYFANPYHSWERGSNENLNGLIRRFLPKGTDFSTVSDETLRTIEYLLNSRPRKRLGWKTPYAVFYEHTGVALQC